jgi:hypothetical protein
MYVIRIARPNGEPDYCAFSTLNEAKRRFHVVDDRIPGDFDGVALFEAPDATNNRKAIEAVKAGHAPLLDQDLWSCLFRARTTH